MAIIISIANQKGGVGKTTTAIELASCFSSRDYKTLAIDFDQQSNLTKYTGLKPGIKGIYEVLKGEVKDIHKVIVKAEEFDVIAASQKLSKADKEFGDALEILKLKKVLKALDDDYDFIIIDSNPSRNVLLNMAYVATDYIIIPAEAEEGSMDGIKSIYNDLKDYKSQDWSSAEVLGVILTRVERTGMHAYAAEEIKEFLQKEDPEAFFMTVRKSIAASEAKSERVSMQSGKTYSNPAMDYRKIADLIIARLDS